MLRSQLIHISQRALVLSFVSFFATTATAETNRDWLGSTSTAWGDAANWNGGVPTSADNASFSGAFTGASQPQVQTSQASTVINGIWMTGLVGKNVTISRSSSNGLTITPIDTINGISGLGILLDYTDADATTTFNLSAPILLGADQEWRNTTNNIANISSTSSIISGSANLTLRSTGTQKQSRFNFANRASTYTGALTIAQGMLALSQVNNTNANGPLGNSANAVVLGDTGDLLGYLRYTGGTAASDKPFTIAAGGRGGFKIEAATPTTLTLSGLISGSGGLVKFGAADNGQASTLALSNTGNDWSGGTSIYDGIISVQAANCLGSGTVTLDYTPAYLGVPGDDGQSGLVALQFTGNTTLDSAGATPRNIVINSGDGGVGGTIDVTTSFSSLAGDGVLSGAGALKVAGTSGLLTMSGENGGFTGTTTVSAAALALSGNGSIANSPVIQVDSGTSLDVSGVTGGANFAGGRFSLASGQTLKGAGNVIGSMGVASGAAISPGASVGTLTTSGNVTINGKLQVEYDIAGDSAIDLLNVFGDLTIAPDAIVDFDNVNLSMTPLIGGPFVFAFYSGALTGTFTPANVVNLPSGYSIQYNYLGNQIALVASAGSAGDYNGDNKVDAADYVLWRKDPNAHGGNPDGYNDWRQHFGNISGSGAGANLEAGGSVPEPTSLVFVGLAGVLFVLGRTRLRTRIWI